MRISDWSSDVCSSDLQAGQSTAVRNGVKAARAAWIATLDGDGQNDPADIPKLLAARDKAPSQVKLFAGWRVNRRDSFNKRISSVIANAVRSRLLRDATPAPGRSEERRVGNKSFSTCSSRLSPYH